MGINFQQSKVFKSFLVVVTAVLFFGSIPITTFANEGSEDKEVLTLAEDLEFLMEEAALYDTDDNLLGFDFEKLENKFGEVDEFNNLEQEIENDNKEACVTEPQITLMASKTTWKSCMIEAMKDHFGIAVIEAALTGGFWAYLEKKAYKEAAKLLLKIGIGGNIIGATAFLTYYSAKCLGEANPGGVWD